MKEDTYNFTERGEINISIYKDLRSRNIGCLLKTKYPEEWDKLSEAERNNFLLANKLDNYISRVQFGHESIADNRDVLTLEGHNNIKQLSIQFCATISSPALEVIPKLPSLTQLTIMGNQFGDEIVKYILECEKLYNIGLQGNSISKAGIRKIRNRFPNSIMYSDHA